MSFSECIFVTVERVESVMDVEGFEGVQMRRILIQTSYVVFLRFKTLHEEERKKEEQTDACSYTNVRTQTCNQNVQSNVQSKRAIQRAIKTCNLTYNPTCNFINSDVQPNNVCREFHRGTKL